MSGAGGEMEEGGQQPDPCLQALLALRGRVDRELQHSIDHALAAEMDARMLLGDVLIFNSTPLPEDLLTSIDSIYSLEAAKKAQPTSDFTGALTLRLPASPTEIVILRGDITSLAVDCIVNAANDQGLGCFVPSHRCIDNVIHRAAGPRLREACRRELVTRPRQQLPAGAPPLVTPGFFLPSKWVLHVTGPALHYGANQPTDREQDLLASAYRECLDAATRLGARSIAFCCLSTGLYNYPGKKAAAVALDTVKRWVEANPAGVDRVVFDVFTQKDDEIYHALAKSWFEVVLAERNLEEVEGRKVAKAGTWLREAEAVLVCAGAGMSVKSGEMVYTNPTDFSHFYPNFRLTRDWDYHTAYDCMGIFEDSRVTQPYKWGFWVSHALNQRYRFTPNAGYAALRSLIGARDYFVYTSNADGCFVRADFNPDQVYTPQGDWQWYQCARPCRADAFWPAKPMLDEAVRVVKEDGSLPAEKVPKCEFCKGNCLPNVRGGDWFLETPHEAAKLRYKSWLKAMQTAGKKVAIVEVGAGFNTPVVTRFPMEALARRMQGASLIRINPTEADVPADIPQAVGIPAGWEVLLRLQVLSSS